MERVLAAEREAGAEVEARRAGCAARVQAARLEARAILDRAEALAQAIHARTERVAATRARAAADAAVADALLRGDPLHVAERVAAWLTDDRDD